MAVKMARKYLSRVWERPLLFGLGTKCCPAYFCCFCFWMVLGPKIYSGRRRRQAEWKGPEFLLAVDSDYKFNPTGSRWRRRQIWNEKKDLEKRRRPAARAATGSRVQVGTQSTQITPLRKPLSWFISSVPKFIFTKSKQFFTRFGVLIFGFCWK